MSQQLFVKWCRRLDPAANDLLVRGLTSALDDARRAGISPPSSPGSSEASLGPSTGHPSILEHHTCIYALPLPLGDSPRYWRDLLSRSI